MDQPPPTERRRCEVLTASQGWREADMASVCAGQIFRLYEPDGRLVRDGETGATRWRALADARPAPGGAEHEVDAEAVPDSDVELTVFERGMYWPGGQRPGGGRLRGG